MIVLAVCEYLTRMQGVNYSRQLEPHTELAIISVVRRIFLDGLRKQSTESLITPETRAATVSWAIYGAAKEWAQTPAHGSAEEIADTVVMLVSPMLHQTYGRL